jgi:hypothetical protein
MSKQRQHRNNSGHGKDRRIRVRGIRRDPPDLKKFSRAIVSLALAQAEAEAQAQQQNDPAETTPPSELPSRDEPEAADGC